MHIFCYYYIILVVMFWLNLWCFFCHQTITIQSVVDDVFGYLVPPQGAEAKSGPSTEGTEANWSNGYNTECLHMICNIIHLYIYTVYPTWSNIYNVCVWLVWGPPPQNNLRILYNSHFFFAPLNIFLVNQIKKGFQFTFNWFPFTFNWFQFTFN